MIHLPGASEFKVQMIGPCGGVQATFLITLEVTHCSHRSLSTSGVAQQSQGHSGLFPESLLGAAPAEVTALGLLLEVVGL